MTRLEKLIARNYITVEYLDQTTAFEYIGHLAGGDSRRLGPLGSEVLLDEYLQDNPGPLDWEGSWV